MSPQEWKRRCIQRIHREVKKAGRICRRDLLRATHYNRGPEGEGIPLWYEALDYLVRVKAVVVERDEYGTEAFVMTPEAAKALRVVSPQAASLPETG